MPTTRIDRVSRAFPDPPHTVFNALTEGSAVATWLPPKGMTGKVAAFEPWIGGRVEIILTYLDAGSAVGRTGADHDRIPGKVTEMLPERCFGFAVRFVSGDPAYSGRMTIAWRIEPTVEGRLLDMTAENVPRGIPPADHQQGMSSLPGQPSALS